MQSSRALTVSGDINLLWQLSHVDLEAVLDLVQGLGISLVRHETDGQAFGAKPASASHLVGRGREKVSRICGGKSHAEGF